MSLSQKKIQLHKSSPKDAVTLDRIHKECLAQEKRTERIYENFQINTPKKLRIFTEKPNNNKFLLIKFKTEGRVINGVDYDSQILGESGPQSTKLVQNISTRLSTLNKIPYQKYAYPQTANQQLGWYINATKNQKNKIANSSFQYPRKVCPETSYADKYYTLQRISPFSRKK